MIDFNVVSVLVIGFIIVILILRKTPNDKIREIGNFFKTIKK